jgi:hypothetical protein
MVSLHWLMNMCACVHTWYIQHREHSSQRKKYMQKDKGEKELGTLEL